MIAHAKRTLAALAVASLAGCTGPKENRDFYLGVSPNNSPDKSAACPQPGGAASVESLYFSSSTMTPEARALAMQLRCQLETAPTPATKQAKKPLNQ